MHFLADTIFLLVLIGLGLAAIYVQVKAADWLYRRAKDWLGL